MSSKSMVAMRLARQLGVDYTADCRVTSPGPLNWRVEHAT